MAMRIQLDRGDKSVDLEHHLDVYGRDQRDELFGDLLKKALLSLGYDEEATVIFLKTKEK